MLLSEQIHSLIRISGVTIIRGNVFALYIEAWIFVDISMSFDVVPGPDFAQVLFVEKQCH
jgi:hypothetical protein